ncbi:MAG TPA: sigma 54-interacting transcriptional regulator, partial [Rhodoferax sp.]|nr:sigma 54-interacting transcriptional regulator [Rhodoferax sp.]
ATSPNIAAYAASKGGLVEAASGGTLFLDEVGDIPLTMQVKLLRLLESGTYRRVGSTELRHADIRVVSATHRDLDLLVAHGRFREDLYYRLSTFPIHLPALRERREDIALLADALLKRVAPKRQLALTPDALAALRDHPFPGNVRELRNLLERASLLCDGETIYPNHIAQALQSGRRQHQTEDSAVAENLSINALKEAAWKQAVASHQGSRAELAARLGMSERSLYRKLKAMAPPSKA